MVWGHVQVNIFNQPISDQHTKYLGSRTEYTTRAVVRLVYVSVSHVIGLLKMNRSLADMTPIGMSLYLHVSTSPKKTINKKKPRYSNDLMLIRLCKCNILILFKYKCVIPIYVVISWPATLVGFKSTVHPPTFAFVFPLNFK